MTREAWIGEQIARLDAAHVAHGHTGDEPFSPFNLKTRATRTADFLERHGLRTWDQSPQAGVGLTISREIAERWLLGPDDMALLGEIRRALKEQQA